MLQAKAKTQVTDIMVHCTACRDTFTIGATIKGRKILKYDTNPHIVVYRNHKISCHCGGRITFLSLF